MTVVLDEDPGLGQAHSGEAEMGGMGWQESEIWVGGAGLWGTWLNKVHGILKMWHVEFLGKWLENLVLGR